MSTNTNHRDEYMKNKSQQQWTSKAKDLLYGGTDNKPITPIHHGKRSVAHAGDHAPIPFATYDGGVIASVSSVQGGQVAKTFQAKTLKKDGAEKVSGMGFDPETYRQALATNAANMSAQKAKARGQAGLLGQHPATPHTAAGSITTTYAEEDQQDMGRIPTPQLYPTHH